MSNAVYKSIEHRVIVNSDKDRVSLAFFYNPRSDIPIEPAKELVTEDRPALYPSKTFDEYRLYIRTKGPSGKAQVESLISKCDSNWVVWSTHNLHMNNLSSIVFLFIRLN